MADFFPRRDADLVQWTANFAKRISADPTAYGLTVQQAADYAAAQLAFAQAYEAARAGATRGLRTVLIKNETRRAVEALTRELARIVRAWPGIDAVKLVGLQLLRGERSGAALPTRGPTMQVKAEGRRVEVKLRRATIPDAQGGDAGGRARPRGAAGAAVYWATGDQPPVTLRHFTLAGNTTRDKMSFVVPLDQGQPGTRVWVTACWLDRRLRPGAASQPVSIGIGGGRFLLAA